MTPPLEAGGGPQTEKPAPATEAGNPQKAHQVTNRNDSSDSGRIGDNNTAATDYRVASHQVSWWSVHEYIAAVLERRGCWPDAVTLSAGR